MLVGAGVVGHHARVVAGRRDQDDVLRPAVVDGVPFRRRDLIRVEAHRHDVEAHVRDVEEGGHVGRVVEVAAVVRSLDADQLALGRDARHSNRVVLRRRDDPGARRPVAVVVVGVVVAVREVPAVDVVDVAVAVVVDPVAGDLARIRPRVRRKVGMRVVEPRVHHRDDDRRIALDRVPSLVGLDVDHVPLVGPVGVVRRRGDLARVVEVGALERRLVAVELLCDEVAPRLHLDDLPADLRQVLQHLRADAHVRRRDLLRLRPLLHLHEQAARVDREVAALERGRRSGRGEQGRDGERRDGARTRHGGGSGRAEAGTLGARAGESTGAPPVRRVVESPRDREGGSRSGGRRQDATASGGSAQCPITSSIPGVNDTPFAAPASSSSACRS